MVNLGKLSPNYQSFGTTHYGPTLAERGGLKVILCFNCKHAHLDPLPPAREVADFYGRKDEFYKGSEKRLDLDAHHHRLGLWDSAHTWETHLLRQHCRPSSRLLDLGAGTGWFVRWWCNEVGSAVGVEPSGYARGKSPVRDRLEANLRHATYRFGDNQPIYLRARLVLEHLDDPAGFLREALTVRQQVRGLIITVPNEFNPLQERLNKWLRGTENFNWFVDKDHLNYFDRRGLANCLRAGGFEPVAWAATFPLELFQLGLGLRYVGDDKQGQQVHLARLRIERLFGSLAWRSYKLLFDRLGWGRELICVAVPKEVD